MTKNWKNKNTNNNQQNTIQKTKTKDWTTWTQLRRGFELTCSGGLARPAKLTSITI